MDVDGEFEIFFREIADRDSRSHQCFRQVCSILEGRLGPMATEEAGCSEYSSSGSGNSDSESIKSGVSSFRKKVHEPNVVRVKKEGGVSNKKNAGTNKDLHQVESATKKIKLEAEAGKKKRMPVLPKDPGQVCDGVDVDVVSQEILQLVSENPALPRVLSGRGKVVKGRFQVAFINRDSSRGRGRGTCDIDVPTNIEVDISDEECDIKGRKVTYEGEGEDVKTEKGPDTVAEELPQKKKETRGRKLGGGGITIDVDHPKFVLRLSPSLNEKTFGRMKQMDVDWNTFSIEPMEDACTCVGCNQLTQKGWVSVLALVTMHDTRHAARIKLLAEVAIHRIERLIASSIEECCDFSKEYAVASRKILRYNISARSAYESSNGTVLHSACIVIARVFLSRRLVLNKCYPYIEDSHKDDTLTFLDQVLQSEAKTRRKLMKDLGKKLENIDPTTFEEIMEGHEFMGTSRKKGLLTGAYAAVLGRLRDFPAPFKLEHFAFIFQDRKEIEEVEKYDAVKTDECSTNKAKRKPKTTKQKKESIENDPNSQNT